MRLTLKRLKEIIIGSTLPTRAFGERQLDKIRALAAFSPDALSSIAYANQEIFLGLVVAGAAGLAMSFTIGAVIVGILVLLTLSYLQTLQGYPSGGGSWIVARENLGKHAGLVAAAALLIDYLLVAAVSITAGVEAIASAFPAILPHRVFASLLILIIITIINLRGTREAGTAMTIPVYLFLFTYLPMLAYGVVRAYLEGPGDLVSVAPTAIQPLTLVLLLHAFSTGCTALTGVEAISNGVPAFEEPKWKNASKTMIAMAFLMGVLFIGSIGLTQYLAVIPGQNETILSALSRRILGDGPLYVLIQVSTLLILAVAANTSFADFPRVTALLASESFIARQLSNLGDRLVFANGMLFLATATALLILVFEGNTHSLIPLFAVGAFLAFTLSQSGMVVHWWRARGKFWQAKAFVNGLGAVMTASALIIIGVSKFFEGAWITFLVIPVIVYIFLAIRQHYKEFDLQMSWLSVDPLYEYESIMLLPRAVIPVSHINRGTVAAVALAKRVAQNVIGVHVEVAEGSGKELLEEWKLLWPGIPLHIILTEYRSVTHPLLNFLDDLDSEFDGESTAVVLPAFVPAEWWQAALHNQTTWQIREAVIDANKKAGVERIVIEVPFLLKR